MKEKRFSKEKIINFLELRKQNIQNKYHFDERNGRQQVFSAVMDNKKIDYGNFEEINYLIDMIDQ